MFQRDGKRYCAVSDEGFRVERSGSPLTRFVLHYVEGSRSINYPLENLMPGSVTPIAIEYVDKWNPPFGDEAISDQRKEQIADRIASALRFLGDKSEVVRKGEST